MTLRLLSYNVRYGGGGREAQLAAAIRECDADLVVLQEATQPCVVEHLAAETGMKVWGAREGHSLAFLSRLEIVNHEWHSPAGVRRALLEIVLAGVGCRVYGVHLTAVHSWWTERRRMREMRAMLELIGRRGRGFHVLLGDFNTLAPGETLDASRLPPRLRALVWLSGGRVRYRTIQIMLDAGYLDGYRLLHPHDVGFTFPTWDPHVRLDYVFLPAPDAERLKSCRVVGLTDEAFKQASDHFPLLAHLDVT